MKKALLFILIISFLLMGCEHQPSIEGLWQVKSVTVGEENMTPNARWMRFNSDFTQESGNGWLQHSIGTWRLDPNNHELTIINTNGIDDSSGPFSATISENEMTWKRIEEGQPIEVKLEKTSQLPTTFGNQLLGLWGAEQSNGNGSFFTEKVQSSDYLFFQWDNRFTLESEKGRIKGIYHVNGHRPEVELIPYNTEYHRESWKIDFKENRITLSSLNTDSTLIRIFKRIHEFPL